jgi:hypothetical protein
MGSLSGTRVPSGMKKPKYNAMCAENEESIIALLNEDLNIDSDDQMDLKNVEETPSEELSDVVLESESKSETSVLRVDGRQETQRMHIYYEYKCWATI